MLDTDLLLTAIRIATNGNNMTIMHSCPECDSLNEYDVDLSMIIDHFSKCYYDNKIVLKDLIIKLQPLTYKQSTEFSLKNFKIQQQLVQAELIEDQEEKKKIIAAIFVELSLNQHEIFVESIESVDIGTESVSEKSYISEWLKNCDKSIFDEIKEKFNINKKAWTVPKLHVKCSECNHETDVAIELDQSNFFGKA